MKRYAIIRGNADINHLTNSDVLGEVYLRHDAYLMKVLAKGAVLKPVVPKGMVKNFIVEEV